MQYFYDGQIRRYLLQAMRAFMHISVESAHDTNGNKTQSEVPVIYGDQSAMVANIIKGTSENTSLPSPIMSMWIASLELDSERRYDPTGTSTVSFTEREFDENTQSYTSNPGNRKTIERYTPVPYKLSLQLDIWTTNTTTKLQILEQILTIFNPMVQLQQNDNMFDWTSIFEMELTKVQWTNRGIPQGAEIDRDIASLVFDLPIFINPPAKVKTSRLIEQIITNVHNTSEFIPEIGSPDFDPSDYFSNNPESIIITPGNFNTRLHNSTDLQLLNMYGASDSALSWKDLLRNYTNDITNARLRFLYGDDPENFDDSILAIFEYALESDYLKINIDQDSVPMTHIQVTSTFNSDVLNQAPINPISGDSYLLISEGKNANPGSPFGLVASSGDIVYWGGTIWKIIDPSTFINGELLLNTSDGNIFIFNNGWESLLYKVYRPGFWRVENVFRKSE